MKSKLYMSEKVENQDRKFGATTKYYPAWVVDVFGYRRRALFTRDQVTSAMARAATNPEDFPALTRWERIISWLTQGK